MKKVGNKYNPFPKSFGKEVLFEQSEHPNGVFPKIEWIVNQRNLELLFKFVLLVLICK